MNAQVKNLWVDALRFGTYQQGKYYLNTDNKQYCCLGVLCDLYKNVTHTGKWIPNERPYTEAQANNVQSFTLSSDISDSKFLPLVVKEWAGMQVSEMLTLSRMNDGAEREYSPCSFDQIADWIETNL